MKQFTVVVDADLDDLVPVFLDNRKLDAEKIRHALAVNDFALLVRIGHNLKGVAGSYGFSGLSQLGLQLQTHAKQEHRKEIEDILLLMSEYLESVDVVYE